MECMSGKMGTSTKESGSTISNMGKVQTCSGMVIHFKGSINMGNQKVSDSTSGVMAVFTLENLLMG